jgi:hypothetical protein
VTRPVGRQGVVVSGASGSAALEGFDTFPDLRVRWNLSEPPPAGSVIYTGRDEPNLRVVDVLAFEDDDSEKFTVLVVEPA